MPRKLEQYQQKTPLRRYVIVALLLLLAAGAWYIDDRQPVLLPIENVKLEGDLRQLSADVLREKIAGVIHGGYFTIDLDVIRDALLQLPWVQDVSVRRQWPGGLYIKITEKTAVARWQQQSLISDQGVLFTPDNGADLAQLPRLEGPEGLHAKVIRFYNELSGRLKQQGLNVTRLSLDQRRAWTVGLSGDVVVRLGRNDVEQRLARFLQVIALHKVLDLRSIQTIDMRYTNGFALRPDNNRETGNNARSTEV